jgi:hypothetical protein
MFENITTFENKKKTYLALAFVPVGLAILYVAYTFNPKFIYYLVGTFFLIIGLILGMYRESLKLDFQKREFLFQTGFANVTLDHVRDSFDNITAIVVREDKIRDRSDDSNATETIVWKLGFEYPQMNNLRFFSVKWFVTEAEAEQSAKVLSRRMGVTFAMKRRGK